MKVDQVITDPRKALQRILRALDSNLNARDNFAPEGIEGHVLTSHGPERKPTYEAPSLSSGDEVDLEHLDASWLTSGVIAEARLQGIYGGIALNWSQIFNTPDTIEGYGITDAYTITEIGILLARKANLGHAHKAADVLSGIFNTSRLGTGAAGAGVFLRGDSTWSAVGWSDITGVAEGLRSVLAPYSRIGHVHDYNSLMNLPAPVAGVTTDVLTIALAPYSRIGHVHDYNSLMNIPAGGGGGGITLEDVRMELAPFARIGHVHNYGSLMDAPTVASVSAADMIGYSRRQNLYFEMEAVAQEHILANQIFGG